MLWKNKVKKSYVEKYFEEKKMEIEKCQQKSDKRCYFKYLIHCV